MAQPERIPARAQLPLQLVEEGILRYSDSNLQVEEEHIQRYSDSMTRRWREVETANNLHHDSRCGHSDALEAPRPRILEAVVRNCFRYMHQNKRKRASSNLDYLGIRFDSRLFNALPKDPDWGSGSGDEPWGSSLLRSRSRSRSSSFFCLLFRYS
jgi:hypothetical protein